MRLYEALNSLVSLFGDVKVEKVEHFITTTLYCETREIMDKECLCLLFKTLNSLVNTVVEDEEHRKKIKEAIGALDASKTYMILWIRAFVLFLLQKGRELGLQRFSQVYNYENEKMVKYKSAAARVIYLCRESIGRKEPIEFVIWDEELEISGISESKYYEFIGYIISKHSYLLL